MFKNYNGPNSTQVYKLFLSISPSARSSSHLGFCRGRKREGGSAGTVHSRNLTFGAFWILLFLWNKWIFLCHLAPWWHHKLNWTFFFFLVILNVCIWISDCFQELFHLFLKVYAKLSRGSSPKTRYISQRHQYEGWTFPRWTLSLWEKLIGDWCSNVDTLMRPSLCLKAKCEEKQCRLL